MNPLEALMAGQARAGMEDRQRRLMSIDKDAAVAELVTFFNDYAAGAKSRFAVGSLVTPKKVGTYVGHGAAHVVLEIIEDRPFNADGHPGESTFGMRPDMRVAVYDGEHVVCFWVESVGFEPFDLGAAN